MAVFLLWLHITYQLSVISAMFPYVYEFKGPRILSRSGSAVAITTPYMPPPTTPLGPMRCHKI